MQLAANLRRMNEKFKDLRAYGRAFNLQTMLTWRCPRAQFAIPEANLDASNPTAFPDFEDMVYWSDANFNLLVDQIARRSSTTRSRNSRR